MRMNFRKEFISSHPVPFGLPRQRVPGGNIVLFEEHAADQRAAVICTAFFLVTGFVFAFLLLTGAVTRSDPIYFKLLLGTAVSLPIGLLCFALLWIGGSSIQELRCEGDAIEVVDAATRADTVIHSAPVDEWRLVFHPVVVNQKPIGKWSGVALSLELGRVYWIVLACQPSEHDLREWRKNSVPWLGRIQTVQGEPWVRQGTIRDYLSLGKRHTSR